MAATDKVEEMVRRLMASVGPPVLDPSVDTSGWGNPPPRRESWVTLQDEVVRLAAEVEPEHRALLAGVLVAVVVNQAIGGPNNQLTAEAFDLILANAPDELELMLPSSTFRESRGGRRYLFEHLWGLPGREGAVWLSRLARIDPSTAGSMFTHMRTGRLPFWPDEDWADRISVIADLPVKERPSLVTSIAVTPFPRMAAPAAFRLALAHGRQDETDFVFRNIADGLREMRGPDPAGDLDLVDWNAHRHVISTPYRWLLELMGEPGDRERLVAAALAAGLVSEDDAEWMRQPVERPAWADGDVPWAVDEVVAVGQAHVPAGRLAGGDPLNTGGDSPPPWQVEVPAGRYPVKVVVGAHPLHPRECAALHVSLRDDLPVIQWRLLRTRYDRDSYGVEVGVASVGSPGAYDSGLYFEHLEFAKDGKPAWATIDAGDAGTMVVCTVGPQHQECRSWLGLSADGLPLALVTDLGLLDLDLEAQSTLTWD